MKYLRVQVIQFRLQILLLEERKKYYPFYNFKRSNIEIAIK